jgi:hypothetical protein
MGVEVLVGGPVSPEANQAFQHGPDLSFETAIFEALSLAD